jgi:hypothetical protein
MSYFDGFVAAVPQEPTIRIIPWAAISITRTRNRTRCAGQTFPRGVNPQVPGRFEGILARNPEGAGQLVGGAVTYAELSRFQIIEGLLYDFPRRMQRTLDRQRQRPKSGRRSDWRSKLLCPRTCARGVIVVNSNALRN